MVIGMPNVGKSSLLNALRQIGLRKGKAARTGAQPGVTRKLGSTVKIVNVRGKDEGVFLMDTPGVFVPYVPNAETMLKLAICGSVKDSIISPTILADYLLYHLNQQDPSLYAEYTQPTNDISVLLDSVARKTGKLQKHGKHDLEAAAIWLVQRWRNGHLGRFLLDTVTAETLASALESNYDAKRSIKQAQRLTQKTALLRSKKRLHV